MRESLTDGTRNACIIGVERIPEVCDNGSLGSFPAAVWVVGGSVCVWGVLIGGVRSFLGRVS